MSPEVGDNREILAYFCFMLQTLSCFLAPLLWHLMAFGLSVLNDI